MKRTSLALASVLLGAVTLFSPSVAHAAGTNRTCYLVVSVDFVPGISTTPAAQTLKLNGTCSTDTGEHDQTATGTLHMPAVSCDSFGSGVTKGKLKLSPWQAGEAPTVIRFRLSFYMTRVNGTPPPQTDWRMGGTVVSAGPIAGYKASGRGTLKLGSSACAQTPITNGSFSPNFSRDTGMGLNPPH